MSPEEIEALATRLAQLMPGYLLLRDPPVVLVGSPESAISAGATPMPTAEEQSESE